MRIAVAIAFAVTVLLGAWSWQSIGPLAAQPPASAVPTIFPRNPSAGGTEARRTPPARAVPTILPRTPEGLDGASASAPDLDHTDLVPATWAGSVPDRAIDAIVRGVTDGDTITVEVAGRTETVRLLLIDTPETKHPNLPVQCYGPEATTYLRKVLPSGMHVYLEPDVEDRDRYGRALRYVWLEIDEVPYLVNEAIVRNGYAVRSIYPPNVRYVDEIGAAQTAARNEGVGLWAACGEYGPSAFE